MHSPLPDPAALAPRVADRARAAAAGLEFGTYLVGVRSKKLAKVSSQASFLAWKGEVKRAAGTLLANDWHPARTVAFVKPQVLFVWDHDKERVETLIRPVCLYGRYRKRSRNLPQTRATWPCKGCRGQGCAACAGTGRLHPTSLEALIAEPCARAFGGVPEESHLHSMGREDVDVLCLGPGRPFVVEVHAPARRTADLAALAREVEAASGGRLELPVGLRAVDDELVARVKEWRAHKVYRAVAESTTALDPARVAGLPAALVGTTLAQRTPHRVARRRTDLVRARRVLALEVTSSSERRVEVRLEVEAGTYIKELVSGDEGRTEPSFAGLLGAACTCAELDVVEIRVDDEAVLSGPAPAVPGEDEEGD